MAILYLKSAEAGIGWYTWCMAEKLVGALSDLSLSESIWLVPGTIEP